MKLHIKRSYTFIEDRGTDTGKKSGIPLRKVAAVVVVDNPYAGRYVKDLDPMIKASAALGHELAAMAKAALAPYSAQGVGKGALVGIEGEQEHANALLTTAFAVPLRDALGGGKAWISSMTKVAMAGTPIDIPMNCKDALYVRSHYDGMTLMLPDAPMPDEIALILCLANRGRLNARVGGLSHDKLKGVDGLV
ncbi:MAG: amino acid synthesis family protein [Burkholderiales bacterium]|nr:amino acid synthesis family protein [Burkholderiales bacterium]